MTLSSNSSLIDCSEIKFELQTESYQDIYLEEVTSSTDFANKRETKKTEKLMKKRKLNISNMESLDSKQIKAKSNSKLYGKYHQ